MGLFARRLNKLRHDPVGYLLDSRHAFLKGIGHSLKAREAERFRALGEAARDRKITVIMTAFNTGHLVEDAVRSVLGQSHDNLELMVIDDASTDDTLDILRSLALEDSRVRVFASPANHGTYWSKNWCLTQATGEFVAFHDSDDRSHRDRLRIQLGALVSNPALMAVTCRWQRVNEQGTALVVDGKLERMAAISLMIRRAPVLEGAGYFDTVRIAADTEYLHRLKHVFGPTGLRHLHHYLYTGLLREGSLTTEPGSGFTWQQDGHHHTRAVDGDRAAYYHAFSGWHARCAGDRAKLRIAFPAVRAFDVPERMLRGCNDDDLAQVVELKGASGQ